MGRAPCCDKNGLKKGPWTPEEDQKLIDYIEKHGHGSWRTLPKNAGLERCGKSCRLRWANYLRPDIKRGRFSFEEEETIIQLHSVLGNKWSTIAARLPGRTDNEIKNYWNTHIRKRLLKMGIDPVTHTPRLDLLDLSSILRTSLCNSSQLNISRLLGIQPLSITPELIRLATTILSAQHEKSEFLQLMQNLQGNQYCNPQIQNHSPLSFQPNNFQSPPIQENMMISHPPCTASSNSTPPPPPNYVPFSNETQQIQGANVGNFQSNNPTNNNNLLNTQQQQQQQQQNSQTWQENLSRQLSLNQGYEDHEFILNCLSENSNFQSNGYLNNDPINTAFSFASILSTSTPSSSQTPLNSSTGGINSSSSNTEDERDSYCSDMLKFEIPDTLDINDFFQ